MFPLVLAYVETTSRCFLQCWLMKRQRTYGWCRDSILWVFGDVQTKFWCVLQCWMVLRLPWCQLRRCLVKHSTSVACTTHALNQGTSFQAHVSGIQYVWSGVLGMRWCATYCDVLGAVVCYVLCCTMCIDILHAAECRCTPDVPEVRRCRKRRQSCKNVKHNMIFIQSE